MSSMGAGSDLSLLDRKFTSADVCRIARITARQLQWWDERKVVTPDQKAHRRVYLARDVISIMVIAELRRKSVSLQKVRSLLAALRRAIRDHLAECFITQSELHLLTDGVSVRLERRPARIIELFKQSREPMFLVSVSDQIKRVVKYSSTPERQMKLF